jgi:hypothetical protein
MEATPPTTLAALSGRAVSEKTIVSQGGLAFVEKEHSQLTLLLVVRRETRIGCRVPRATFGVS